MDKTMHEKLGKVHVKCNRSNDNIQSITVFLVFQLSAFCRLLDSQVLSFCRFFTFSNFLVLECNQHTQTLEVGSALQREVLHS